MTESTTDPERKRRVLRNVLLAGGGALGVGALGTGGFVLGRRLLSTGRAEKAINKANAAAREAVKVAVGNVAERQRAVRRVEAELRKASPLSLDGSDMRALRAVIKPV